MVTREGSRSASAEQRLKGLGIKLPAVPELFGTYVEAVRMGNLLFRAGCFPRKATGRNSLGAWAWSSMWKRGARLLASQRSTSSLAGPAPEVERLGKAKQSERPRKGAFP